MELDPEGGMVAGDHIGLYDETAEDGGMPNGGAELTEGGGDGGEVSRWRLGGVGEVDPPPPAPPVPTRVVVDGVPWDV